TNSHAYHSVQKQTDGRGRGYSIGGSSTGMFGSLVESPGLLHFFLYTFRFRGRRTTQEGKQASKFFLVVDRC
uniref:Uncharacterized protein n=1 Tax=Triticum urartu TaxID=4572 RepID=A0A8R7V117_TRIUA